MILLFHFLAKYRAQTSEISFNLLERMFLKVPFLFPSSTEVFLIITTNYLLKD